MHPPPPAPKLGKHRRSEKKVKGMNNVGATAEKLISHGSYNPRSAPTYPEYDIEAENEVFDATTDFRTLVVLPGHPLGS